LERQDGTDRWLVFETDWEVWRGFWIGMLMHLLQIPLVVILTLIGAKVVMDLEFPFGWVSPLFIGVTQFLYLGPLIYRKRKEREYEFVKGIWICSGVTILLNSICWAPVFFWR